MPRKDEIIASIQGATSDLDAIVSLLPDVQRSGSLGVRADLIESCANDLLGAAHQLREYETAQQELQAAVQSVQNGRA
jgi:hypothetical protein